MKPVLWVALVLLAGVLDPPRLAAYDPYTCSGSCWGVTALGDRNCVGPNCSDSCDYQVCGRGCTCGQCHNNGSSEIAPILIVAKYCAMPAPM